MKRLLVVIAMMFATVCTFSETVHVETFGGWDCYETRSMMDAPHWDIRILGEPGCFLAYACFSSGSERFFVMFDDYIGGDNERHEEPLLYVSDLTEVVTLRHGLYRTGPSVVAFAGDLIVGTLMTASELMFRTEDYRGNHVDVLFLLTPTDTAAAFEWLYAQR